MSFRVKYASGLRTGWLPLRRDKTLADGRISSVGSSYSLFESSSLSSVSLPSLEGGGGRDFCGASGNFGSIRCRGEVGNVSGSQ